MKKQYSFLLSTLLVISIVGNIVSWLLKFSAIGGPDKSLDDRIYNSLHTNGSMNVVFMVIAVILLGLFITLFRIDRKVSRLEEEMKGPKS